jgi:hypothetical protein
MKEHVNEKSKDGLTQKKSIIKQWETQHQQILIKPKKNINKRG